MLLPLTLYFHVIEKDSVCDHLWKYTYVTNTLILISLVMLTVLVRLYFILCTVRKMVGAMWISWNADFYMSNEYGRPRTLCVWHLEARDRNTNSSCCYDALLHYSILAVHSQVSALLEIILALDSLFQDNLAENKNIKKYVIIWK